MDLTLLSIQNILRFWLAYNHVSTVYQISEDVCRLACVGTLSDRVIARKLIGSCVTVLYLKVFSSSVKVKISCTSEHNIAVWTKSLLSCSEPGLLTVLLSLQTMPRSFVIAYCTKLFRSFRTWRINEWHDLKLNSLLMLCQRSLAIAVS